MYMNSELEIILIRLLYGAAWLEMKLWDIKIQKILPRILSLELIICIMEVLSS